MEISQGSRFVVCYKFVTKKRKTYNNRSIIVSILINLQAAMALAAIIFDIIFYLFIYLFLLVLHKYNLWAMNSFKFWYKNY